MKYIPLLLLLLTSCAHKRIVVTPPDAPQGIVGHICTKYSDIETIDIIEHRPYFCLEDGKRCWNDVSSQETRRYWTHRIVETPCDEQKAER